MGRDSSHFFRCQLPSLYCLARLSGKYLKENVSSRQNLHIFILKVLFCPTGKISRQMLYEAPESAHNCWLLSFVKLRMFSSPIVSDIIHGSDVGP